MEKLRNRQILKSKSKILIGAIAICVIITLAGSGICAVMISREIVPERNMGHCAMVILLLASIVGAGIANANSKDRKLYAVLIACALYESVLLILTAALFGAGYQGVGVTSMVIFSGGALAFMCTNKKNKGRNRRGYKTRSC